MELIAHIIIPSLIFGYSLSLILGSIAPDFLFIISFFKKKFKFKRGKIWVIAEKLHSIFIPMLLALIGFIFKLHHLLFFSLGYGTHIFIDVLAHKKPAYGCRYFYPLIKKRISSGLFYFETKKRIFLSYIILLILMWIKYR